MERRPRRPPLAATLLSTAMFLRCATAFRPPAAARAPTRLRASSEAAAPVARRTLTRRILSGVQPTGSIHLGNYLGAIKQWVDLQDSLSVPLVRTEVNEKTGAATEVTEVTENFYCVVDLHAITAQPHDPSALLESTRASAALYLAAGIDPGRSTVFVQSHVPAHSELAWLLNCVTPMNWLERMIQYKEKSAKQGDGVGVGLFDYPVLMAADILLYGADRVPVGEDQRQHLELTRDIARRFNDQYCKGNPYKKRCKAAGLPSRPVLTEPEAMIVKEGARVMSLTDGNAKMSKSDPSDASRLNILDPPDLLRKKIGRCKTDSMAGIAWDDPARPEAVNLLNIYAAVQPDRSRESIADEVRDLNWGAFKPLLADAVVAHLEPLQQRYREVREDPTYLDGVLAEGASAAEEVAGKTLHAARTAMGFAPRT